MSDEPSDSGKKRVIKRYTNRKLYDTVASKYVTLLQIGEMLREGEDVQIVDNQSKEDKTDVTLALIISEELKERPRAIPLATLKLLFRHRGERLLTSLRGGPIGRLMPKDGQESEVLEVTDEKDAQKGLRATLEQWQQAIDDRIRAVLPSFSGFRDLQAEIRRLSERIDALEKKQNEREP